MSNSRYRKTTLSLYQKIEHTLVTLMISFALSTAVFADGNLKWSPGSVDTSVSASIARQQSTRILNCLSSSTQGMDYVGSTLWGFMSSFQIVDNYCYCAMGNGLQILDVSEPASPQLVSQLLIQCGTSLLVNVQGGIAYVAVDAGGGNNGFLKTIDVSNPLLPKLVGSLVLPQFPVPGGLAVEGHLAFVVAGSLLIVCDVSNPSNPIRVGSYGSNYVGSVVVKDSIAIVSGERGGLEVINVSNPQAPTSVGSCNFDGMTRGMRQRDSLVYVLGCSGLHIVNVAIPSVPKVIGAIGIPWGCYSDIAFADTLGFLATNIGGPLFIINLSDPSFPELLSQNDLLIPVPQAGGARGVQKIGNYLFVSGNGSFQVLDLTNPISPTRVGYDYLPYEIQDVAVSGYLLSAIERYAQLHVVDVSDPSVPFATANLWFPGVNANCVAMSGNFAYIGTYADDSTILEVIDLSTPSSPSLVGQLKRGPYEANDILVDSPYVYLALGFAGISIVDVNNATDPKEIARIESIRYARRLCLSDSLMYVALYDSGLAVFNVKNPLLPTVVGKCVVQGYGTSLVVLGEFAYLGGGYNGIKIINVSNPVSPVVTSSFSPPGVSPGCSYGTPDISSLGAAGSRLVVSAWCDGVFVYDVSNDPTSPRLMGSYNTPGYSYGVAAEGHNLFVADSRSLMILSTVSTGGYNCCIGRAGNIDDDCYDHVDISDLSTLIDFLYISYTMPQCLAEANVDGDDAGGVDISDLSALIDYLYISFTPPAACQ